MKISTTKKTMLSIVALFAVVLCASYLFLGKKCKDTESRHGTSLIQDQDKGEVNISYTREELSALEKWKNKSFDDLVLDSFNGDSSGLYKIGQCFLFGNKELGITIDVSGANQFFALSASLGFAPALDKIKFMYVDDNPNPWLATVYYNLVASLGHTEFLIGYHKMRNEIVKKFGQGFMQEIERIAAQKQELILKNQKDLAAAANKEEFIVTKMTLITLEDVLLGKNYWAEIFRRSKEKK
jgi:hypothetical protein